MLFQQFNEMMETPKVAMCIRHAIRNYAEASYAATIESKLAHTHAALTAIVRWDQEIFRGQFRFVEKLRETITSNKLDRVRWFSVASDIHKYRSQSLHVQPAWSHHGDPVEFRVWSQGQDLIEHLLSAKMESPLNE